MFGLCLWKLQLCLGSGTGFPWRQVKVAFPSNVSSTNSSKWLLQWQQKIKWCPFSVSLPKWDERAQNGVHLSISGKNITECTRWLPRFQLGDLADLGIVWTAHTSQTVWPGMDLGQEKHCKKWSYVMHSVIGELLSSVVRKTETFVIWF